MTNDMLKKLILVAIIHALHTDHFVVHDIYNDSFLLQFT
jgi:hypothetical protein